MNRQVRSRIAIGVVAALAFSPLPGFAKSNTSATCSGGSASTSGSSDIVGLVVAGLPVLNLNPNVAISLPGGLSLIINEQTSSSSGANSGSMIVNGLHITGPSIDIVVSSAQSGITC